MRASASLAIAVLVPAAAFAAAPPSALARVSGGLWEIARVPATGAPVRQCVLDIMALAQFEHRGKNCAQTVLSDKPRSTLISYTCGAAGFGQSQIDVVTPRALSISTQGISDDLPFNYVLQARRVGDCGKASSSTHH